MKKTKAVITTAIIFSMLMSISLLAGPEEKIEKTFEKKENIRFKLVLGDLELKKSSDNRIHVHLVYSYGSDVTYEPKLEERGNRLYLEEKTRGKNVKGYSKWTVSIPDDIEIDFKSATGDLVVSGLDLEIDGNTGTGDIDISHAKGEYDVNTGTGNVDVYDSEGEFDLNSGTGKVRVENCKGNFDVNSGTGDVEGKGLFIEFEGNFSSGTGDAEVEFPDGGDFELSLSSGTDDAVLNMSGKPIQGYFEFRCHARKGRIISPVNFDIEEEYEANDQTYLKKSFTKGNEAVKIYIKTGTGTARLNK